MVCPASRECHAAAVTEPPYRWASTQRERGRCACWGARPRRGSFLGTLAFNLRPPCDRARRRRLVEGRAVRRRSRCAGAPRSAGPTPPVLGRQGGGRARASVPWASQSLDSGRRLGEVGTLAVELSCGCPRSGFLPLARSITWCYSIQPRRRAKQTRTSAYVSYSSTYTSRYA